MASSLNGQRHNRTALILYGTETGNSQDVAEDLGRMVERLHFVTRVIELDLVEIGELSKYTIVLFAISTTGQGEFPSNARKFWKSLLRKRLPPGCLGHVTFTTFGLGDSSYAKFNITAKKLHKRLEQLGAKVVYPRGEGDDQHDEGIDGTFLSWASDLRKTLLASYPLPDGVEPIPPQVFLLPKFELQIEIERTTTPSLEDAPRSQQVGIEKQTNISFLDSQGSTSHSLNQTLPAAAEANREESIQEIQSNHPSTPTMFRGTGFELAGPWPCEQLKDAHPGVEESPADLDATPKTDAVLHNGFMMCLASNKRVTPESHWQDVRELTFYTPESEIGGYQPGDSIMIMPKNFPQEVQALIDLQGWNDIANTPLVFAASNPGTIEPNLMERVPPEYLPQKDKRFVKSNIQRTERCTLRELLTSHFDITAIPRRSFFEAIAHHTEDEMHKDRLLEFADAAFRDEFYDYTTRPRRSILEVLQDFPTVKLPWKWAFTFFPLIKGRKYSICSGGFHKTYIKNNRDYFKVQLLVAIVKYRTVLKKIRQGLCSRYLASLQEGAVITVLHDTSHAFYRQGDKKADERAIICIAPGTGVAPCRSVIFERAMEREQEAMVHSDKELRLKEKVDAQFKKLAAKNGIENAEMMTRKIWAGKNYGECYLFYGGRNRHADFFFEEDWRYKNLNLQVFTAFSRDQQKKIYVQDVIREQGKLIGELMTRPVKPIIYVCGSSGEMPKAVRAALVEVCAEHVPDATVDSSDNILSQMEKLGLYVQETW